MAQVHSACSETCVLQMANFARQKSCGHIRIFTSQIGTHLYRPWYLSELEDLYIVTTRYDGSPAIVVDSQERTLWKSTTLLDHVFVLIKASLLFLCVVTIKASLAHC